MSPPSQRRLKFLSRLQQAGDATFEHPTHRSQRCAMVEGFSVHANVAVNAEDRAGLERICRYGLRSPLACQGPAYRIASSSADRIRLLRSFSQPAFR